MALQARKLREVIFHFLYSLDFGSGGEDVIPFLMAHHKVTKKSVYEAQAFVQKVLEKVGELDEVIQKHAVGYALDRIPKVEKNLLRLGIFEMMHCEGMPRKVAIAEAIRLSRKFTTKEGAQFVNAVLDAI